MNFSGFPKELIGFLMDLQANNTKSWMDAHKADYESYVMQPARDFIAAFAPASGPLGPDVQAVPKMNQSIRRFARDVRFSKDKTPYNSRLHILFWRTGKPNKGPGYHLVIHPDRIGLGAGFFGFPPPVLQAYREAVVKDGAALADALAQVETAEAGTLVAPELKTVPKGFASEGPQAELLKHKGLVMRREYDIPAELFSADAVDWVVEKLTPYRPLIDWLVKNLGKD